MSDGARCFYCKKSPRECKELCPYCGYALPNHNAVCIGAERELLQSQLDNTRRDLAEGNRQNAKMLEQSLADQQTIQRLEAELAQAQKMDDELTDSLNRTLEYARQIAGRRDVHSVEEVLDELRSQHQQERELSDQLAAALKIAEHNAKHNRIDGTQCWTTCSACVYEAALSAHAAMRATAARSSGTDSASPSLPRADSDSR